MIRLELGGEWDLSRIDAPDFHVCAPVPGSVHDALLASGTIPDINYRLNEYDALWVGEKDWIYERDFELDDDIMRHEHLSLLCEGLDTLSEIFVNDHFVASTKNMFRHYEFKVRHLLLLGKNRIRILFRSPLPLMREKTRERHLPAWNEDTNAWDADPNRPVTHWGYTGRGYIRKQSCQFGWDWGPMTPSAGIWRPISLLAWSGARIADCEIFQKFSADYSSAFLEISLKTDFPLDVKASLSLRFEGNIVASLSSETFYAEKTFSVELKGPRLWWPNGMGEQALYDLALELFDANGKSLDSMHKRIGIRSLRLIREPDAHGTSFVFEANGRRFFAKGSNWIPIDQYPSSLRHEERCRRLLGDAKAANMNMMRVWGGGYFEGDDFYGICDELGICVWQDMMFGCGAYPTWDAEFMDEVFHEVLDNARRIRQHACLACWCGNNELEMGFCEDDWSDKKLSWNSYFALFERLIPSALMIADPQTAYIPGSPHSAPEERKNQASPKSGDCHLWEIWFTEAPFENYRNYAHRFISEFGYQSFPDIATIRSFTTEEDRKFDGEVLVKRQRSGPGNQRVLLRARDFFGDSDDFETICLLSQIAHGMGLKIGIEHWRRSWPRCAGTTYWQLNDCWPAQTWSSIDSFGRWKAAHYFARRFFSPILISGLENPVDHSISIFLNNDLAKDVRGSVSAMAYDTAGRLVLEEKWKIAVSGISVSKVADFEAGRQKCADPCELSCFLVFEPDEDLAGSLPPIYENLVLFSRPRLIPFQTPDLKCSLEKQDEKLFHLKLKAMRPSPWISIRIPDFKTALSDNFFPLRPGKEYSIEISAEEKISADKLGRAIEIRTYPSMEPKGILLNP